MPLLTLPSSPSQELTVFWKIQSYPLFHFLPHIVPWPRKHFLPCSLPPSSGNASPIPLPELHRHCLFCACVFVRYFPGSNSFIWSCVRVMTRQLQLKGFTQEWKGIRFSRLEAHDCKSRWELNRELQVRMYMTCFWSWGLRVRQLLLVKISVSWNLEKNFSIIIILYITHHFLKGLLC